MTLELPDFPEPHEKRQRRLKGRRAEKPDEGFADTRIIPDSAYEKLLSDIIPLGQRLARLSRTQAMALDYEDNPDQFLLACPFCHLENDFTFEGRQIYYFASEFFHGSEAPTQSTTTHRIRILKVRDDGAIECQCGACDKSFLQQQK